MNRATYSSQEIAALLAEACLHSGVIDVDGAIHANRPDWAQEAIQIFEDCGWIARVANRGKRSTDAELVFDMAAWRKVLLPLKARHGHPLDGPVTRSSPR